MIQVIINGLLIGAVYSLIAVGLTMIHGVMKIVNFAQGELLMVGMYVTYVLYGVFVAEGSAPCPSVSLCSCLALLFSRYRCHTWSEKVRPVISF